MRNYPAELRTVAWTGNAGAEDEPVENGWTYGQREEKRNGARERKRKRERERERERESKIGGEGTAAN